MNLSKFVTRALLGPVFGGFGESFGKVIAHKLSERLWPEANVLVCRYCRQIVEDPETHECPETGGEGDDEADTEDESTD